MRLDYGTLLSNEPIVTGIGTIEPPTLLKIRKQAGFVIFGLYEMYLRMTPKQYYYFIMEDGKEKWDNMGKKERSGLEMYDIVLQSKEMQTVYQEIFNFFFSEKIVFVDGCFVVLNKQDIDIDSITVDDVRGIIYKKNFDEVRDILQQVCGFNAKRDDSRKALTFKNDKARELYERIYGKADDESDIKENLEGKEIDYNLTLPNIISAVSNCHPTISPLNVWELTIFQLVDSFQRTTINKVDGINRTSVAVWGDEDNTFKNDQWLSNRFDAKDDDVL
jgi:hypothetical protein